MMNIKRAFRTALLSATMLVSTSILAGKAFAQQQQQAKILKKEIVKDTIQNGECVDIVTKEVVTKAKTPQQIYNERWAAWKKKNNATDAQVKAAQAEENEQWKKYRSANQQKASAAISAVVAKTVEKTENVLSVDTDCPDGDCDTLKVGVIPAPILRDTIVLDCDPEVVVKELNTYLETVQKEEKAKRPWTVRAGVGVDQAMGDNSTDAYSVLTGKKNTPFVFAEIETPRFADKGIGSIFSAVGGVELYQPVEAGNALLAVQKDFENKYYEYSTTNANAGRNIAYVGLKASKIIPVDKAKRVSIEPRAFAHTTASLTKEKHNIVFSGEGFQPQMDKKNPLDARVGAGAEIAVNLSGKEKRENGNGFSFIASADIVKRDLFQDSRNTLIPEETDFRTNLNAGSNLSGMFKVGFSYKFGGKKPAQTMTRSSRVETNWKQDAEAKVELLKIQQQNREARQNGRDISVQGVDGVNYIIKPAVKRDTLSNPRPQ